MVAGLALATSQPVGHLLDLLGVDRCWPDVFDAFFTLLARGEKKEARAEDPTDMDTRLEKLNARLAGGRR